MKKSLIDRALRLAVRKIARHPQYDFFIHYTFVVQKNSIIGFGMNCGKTPAVFLGYHERMRDLNYTPKMHSEINAWFKSYFRLNPKRKYIVINLRLNKKGEIRQSKPCSCCQNFLNDKNCRKIYFFDENYSLTCL